MRETILQFGTGRFLRGFVDLFVHETNQGESPAGTVTAVQSTGSERARQINQAGGRYRLAIRGVSAGQTVDETVEVTSIGRALAAGGNWDEVLAAARSDSLKAVVSNTTEAGLTLGDHDRPDDAPPRSFPAKLLRCLEARFQANQAPVAILPCELIENNGQTLRELVLQQAARWELPADVVEWIRHGCTWHNTLVDRIVSAPNDDDPLAADPLSAVAEPFAQWLIAGRPEVPGLVEHPAVQSVDSVYPYALRKVRILNGAHTALVAKALPLGIATVREAVDDERVGPWLRQLLFEEIVPTVADSVPEAEAFARDALQRFANPFLDHRLADIALHHDTKLQTRLAPTCEEYRATFGRQPPLLSELLDSA